MALGFEPTTFRMWVSSHNHLTRAPTQVGFFKSHVIYYLKANNAISRTIKRNVCIYWQCDQFWQKFSTLAKFKKSFAVYIGLGKIVYPFEQIFFVANVPNIDKYFSHLVTTYAEPIQHFTIWRCITVVTVGLVGTSSLWMNFTETSSGQSFKAPTNWIDISRVVNNSNSRVSVTEGPKISK